MTKSKHINNKNKYNEEYATEQNVSSGTVDKNHLSTAEKAYRAKEDYESKFIP